MRMDDEDIATHERPARRCRVRSVKRVQASGFDVSPDPAQTIVVRVRHPVARRNDLANEWARGRVDRCGKLPGASAAVTITTRRT